jgi:TonB family protein
LPSGLSEYDRGIILQHEKVHAKKMHSADRIYLETIHCLSWFNPILLLLKKELVHIHEFEVDRIMYNKYHVGYMEFLLAYSLGTSSSSYLFTNQFMTKLTLIKRIKIMKKNSKKVLIAALALPIIAGGMTLISFTRTSDHNPKVEPNPALKRQTESPKVEPKSKEVKVDKVPETTQDLKPMKEIDVPNLTTESTKDEKKVQFIPPSEKMPEISTKLRTLDTKTSAQETEIDKMPEYPGGTEGLTKYLVNNLHYPEAAVSTKTTGKVFVSFIVSKDGKITNPTIKRGVSKELDNEALRVISSMPNWIPGEKDGKKVDAEMVLPVSFKL